MIYDRIFEIFEEISKIPRGSGNTEKISRYCVEFAKKLGLDYYDDFAGNVIIYKPGVGNGRTKETLILQGHTDMVCQKTDESEIDFEQDGLKLYRDGDFIKADGTTLGADNGIAVAIILAILESKDMEHPPLEAVFTADEEIGMVGAGKLDFSKLSGKRMLNLDAETPHTVTVSCAGGCDVILKLPVSRKQKNGTRISIKTTGLLGGHSGVEIDKGRINATLLTALLLNKIYKQTPFELIGINGGEKRNAIPVSCSADFLVTDDIECINAFNMFSDELKKEFSSREPTLDFCAEKSESGICSALSTDETRKVINTLLCAPDGVQSMSADVEGLVETSLNLGVTTTCEEKMTFQFLLRSNKKGSLDNLISKLKSYADITGCVTVQSGFYPPWEYKTDSKLRQIYKDVYKSKFGTEPAEEAIHAGQECGVFAENIKDFDCISFGPVVYDIHTVNERLSISSTIETVELLIALLKNI